MKIIAFGHKKRTGKDTACKLMKAYIESKHLTVLKTAFADKLYDIAHQLYSWDGQKGKYYYDEINPDAKEQILPTIGKTPRQILIDLGTPAIRRCVYADTWVDYTLKTNRGVDVLLISDLRFPNEFRAVKNLGGKCIKITRDSAPNTDDVADNALDNETGWDAIIPNNGSVSELGVLTWEKIKEYICDSSTSA